MKRTGIVILLVFSEFVLLAQGDKISSIKFSGFVKTDFIYDSRQTVAAREGHFLLWPSPKKLDYFGEDINAVSNFNFLAVQSRITGSISGPDAFGAKTSGVIEADFFAQANANINLLRLRHAFVKLNWDNLEILTGQYWNPLFVTDCFPGTVSFNTGTPLQSFARNPQVRATYTTGNFRVTAAALSQRDYATAGESGTSSSYLRNSGRPDMHFQVQYTNKTDETGGGFLMGMGMAYKTIVPRLENVITQFPLVSFKVDEKVGGLTAIAYSKLITRPVTIKVEARYGENISDLLAISGFAIERTDPFSGVRDYTPLKSMTFWGELHSNGNLQFGLFGGISRNLGTKDPIEGNPDDDVFGLGNNIRRLVRLSPRIIFNSGKTRIALEMEYTSAAYGRNYDEYYIPGNTIQVANIRGLLGVYYFF